MGHPTFGCLEEEDDPAKEAGLVNGLKGKPREYQYPKAKETVLKEGFTKLPAIHPKSQNCFTH